MLPETSADTETIKPHWNAVTRELQFQDVIVKCYKWKAENQEMVLNAFQEEGWPHRIDDPLPPQRDQDCKRRLCDTIKCLNRKQTNGLIRFHGDGTGEGVFWKRLEENEERSLISQAKHTLASERGQATSTN